MFRQFSRDQTKKGGAFERAAFLYGIQNYGAVAVGNHHVPFRFPIAEAVRPTLVFCIHFT